MPSRASSPEISHNSSINGRDGVRDSFGSGNAAFDGPSSLRTRAGSHSEIVTRTRAQETEGRKKRNRQVFIFPSGKHVGESLIYNGDDAPTAIGGPQDPSTARGSIPRRPLASEVGPVNA